MIKSFNNIKLYKYGKQNFNFNIIKLNSNENSFPPSIKIVKNVIKEIKFFGNILRFYPDSNSNKLKLVISNFYNLELNCIFIGNGSDEIIGFIFFFLYRNKNYLKLNDLTYIFYESYIKLYNIKYKIIKLNKSLIKKNYKKNYSNIIITNPNVPSGNILNLYDIKKLIVNNLSSLIILDETYIDFFYINSINLIKVYKNVILIRTLSKSRSLAGVRIGICFSNNIFITILNKIKNSFNTYPINSLSQIISEISYKDVFYFEKIKIKININKLKLKKFFLKKNFFIFNSKSNYILIINNKINTNKLIKFLDKNFIYTRKFEIPKLENYIRLTIGLKKNCIHLIKKINYFLKLNK